MGGYATLGLLGIAGVGAVVLVYLSHREKLRRLGDPPCEQEWDVRKARPVLHLNESGHMAKGSHGFKPDHYNQTGFIHEQGVAVMEYGTRLLWAVK